MDYSLLIGIHDLVKGNKQNIRDTTLAVFDPEQLQKAAELPPAKRGSKAQAMRRMLSQTETVKLGPSEVRLPEELPNEYVSQYMVSECQ